MEGSQQQESQQQEAEHTRNEQLSSAQEQDVDANEDDDTDYLKQEENLSEEQEATLFAFLQKVQKACGDDSSLPDFIGLQVNDWIKELEVKQQPPSDNQE